MAFIGIKSKTEQKIRPDLSPMPEFSQTEVAISPAAAARIQALLLSEKPGSLLRVGVQGGGCSGLKPYFAFEAALSENDQVFTSAGVSICVDPRSLAVIGGSQLDFDNGFKLKSQKLKKACSCGESFSMV